VPLDAATGAVERPDYIGRFAPTPSGPLHLGSLLAAAASWLDARARRGRWLVRIDDLDAPRIKSGAEGEILATLEAHGLLWDGSVVRQSDHREHYRAALEELGERCFGCRCTRSQLRGARRYPGTCRDSGLPRDGNAVRVRVENAAECSFDDRVAGRREPGAESMGDFVVWRRDGLPSYPLAVVVDDAAMRVSHVVRGADLLDNTPQQIHLAACLGVVPPVYAHVPVLVDAAGEKLSKHNAATAIDQRHARGNVAVALSLLGLQPPNEDVPTMLNWAVRHWRIECLPNSRTVPGFVALS